MPQEQLQREKPPGLVASVFVPVKTISEYDRRESLTRKRKRAAAQMEIVCLHLMRSQTFLFAVGALRGQQVSIRLVRVAPRALARRTNDWLEREFVLTRALDAVCNAITNVMGRKRGGESLIEWSFAQETTAVIHGVHVELYRESLLSKKER